MSTQLGLVVNGYSSNNEMIPQFTTKTPPAPSSNEPAHVIKKEEIYKRQAYFFPGMTYFKSRYDLLGAG